MKSTVQLLVDDSTRGKWDTFVEASETASMYHLSAWKDVIEKSFGHKTYYLFSCDDLDNINGILPLVHMKSRIFGNFLVSVPFFSYGGVCSDDDRIVQSLVGNAVELAKELGARHIEFRQKSPVLPALPVKTTKVSMRLELDRSPDILFKSFPSKLRSQIVKPLKEGFTVQFGREEALEPFYDVFSVNMRDLGTPVYSKAFFRNVLSHFSDHTWICTVFHEGTPVASGFLAGFKERMEIPWASSLKKYNKQSPNMLLYWSCLKFSCESGYKTFDFGRSTSGCGTYKFKEQWGSKPSQLYWYYWLKDQEDLPQLNPENPKYQLAIDLWRKLPVPVTRWFGPRIVKNLP